MQVGFQKLCAEICFKPTSHWKNCVLNKAEMSDDKVFNLYLTLDLMVPVVEMQRFFGHLNENFRFVVKPHFTILTPTFDQRTLVDYLSWVLKTFTEATFLANLVTEQNTQVDYQGNLHIKLASQESKEAFDKVQHRLKLVFCRLGLPKLTINATCNNKSLGEQIDATFTAEAQRFMERSASANTAFSNRPPGFKSILQVRNSPNKWVTFSGTIFHAQVVTTKNKLQIFTFHVTDYTEALLVKKFFRPSENVAEYQTFRPGDFVVVTGKLDKDRYSGELCVTAQFVKRRVNQDHTRREEGVKMRVELGARSKMSTMDGLASATAIYNRALTWNHPAVAITDLNNVQAFPDFFAAAKGNTDRTKPIYGTTVQVSKSSEVVRNTKRANLATTKYIVFDLETTGLHARHCKIIEFGGTTVNGRQVMEDKNHNEEFFMCPGTQVPVKITEITGITTEMLANGYKEEEGLRRIKEYFGNHTLVVHNASFDIRFLNRKFMKYNIPLIKNTVIDTLPLARRLFPKAKRHTLESLAVRFKIEYDSTVAHRANYDARVLARVWQELSGLLVNENCTTIEDIRHFAKDKKFKKPKPYEVTLLAKTPVGLKNLFRLVSLSHTKRCDGFPVLLFEDITQHREGLFVGSPAQTGELWDLALNAETSDLTTRIQECYDYVEVTPVGNHTHTINRGEITLEIFQKATRDLIAATRAAKKLVVATSQPRYLDPHSKFAHQIYVESKGLGGVLHPVFKYQETEPDYPNYHFYTTSEMKKAFGFLKDSDLINKIVVENPCWIASQIVSLELFNNELHTPKIPDAASKLTRLVYAKAHAQYGKQLPTVVANRLQDEFKAILKYKYAVIYLIAYHLVKKSLQDGYLVGSRGSVGSSFVAHLAGITEVNPLSPHYYCRKCQHSEFFADPKVSSGYDLPRKLCPHCQVLLKQDGHTIPFATFLGFAGDKVPDIDLNFSGDYQSKVHEEVRRLFGKDHTFRAGTIATVARKTAYGYVLTWANKRNLTLSKPYVEYLVGKLAGTKRTTGQHPGGIIIIPHEFEVEDFTPVNFPANDTASAWMTTHFDFHALHNNLLKLDLLGHDDPTAIRMLQDLTGVTPDNIPDTDPRVLSLFSSPSVLKVKASAISGETTGAIGIPEFGTEFVRGILKEIKVTSFADLISISGLSHGTNIWSDNFRGPVTRKELTLSEIISCRDDIMNGLIRYGLPAKTAFTIMEQVRKGQGISAAQEAKMDEHSVPEWYVRACKKIQYMFPKAHATAYVKMAWRVAWFKIYHPLAYYATYFTTRADALELKVLTTNKAVITKRLAQLKKLLRSRSNTTKITSRETTFITILEVAEEMYARGFKILPVNLRLSAVNKWIISDDKNHLIPPFVAVDGIGLVAARSVVQARAKTFFVSEEDLLKRTHLSKTNVEDLRVLGVLDQLPKNNQLGLFE